MFGQMLRPLSVGPPISVELQPATQVVPTGRATATDITVNVRNNVAGGAKARLRLETPPGWTVAPPSQDISFLRDGEVAGFTFKVSPGRLDEGRYEVRAVAEYNGKDYTEGYSIVTRQDIDTFYYYRPARQRVRAIAVSVPPRLRVGYIVGAGDEIPEILKQLGVNVEIISPTELAAGNLNRFQTIVIGIRAYDVRGDVRDQNRRLLDFVSRGGTLVVQYNQNVTAFNAGSYTPYPITATTLRVTVEEAPVEILAPRDGVFHYPNRITASDFEGWVQERGVYFFDKGAPKPRTRRQAAPSSTPATPAPLEKWGEYKPLLSSHDPGEPPLEGGLLRASYGKGTYILTGYAFFRQLPAGVPGATRLFANLISAGHEKLR
jgi:hypothetical protein